MDNRYYDRVIEEMQPFFDEQGFKSEEDGSFKNDKKAVKKICAVNILTIKQMCSIFKKKNEVSHGQKGTHR